MGYLARTAVRAGRFNMSRKPRKRAEFPATRFALQLVFDEYGDYQLAIVERSTGMILSFTSTQPGKRSGKQGRMKRLTSVLKDIQAIAEQEINSNG